MTVAVLVLTHNGKAHLSLALSSLLEATTSVPECRVVVVDNESTDGTPEWVRQNFPTLEIVHCKNDYLFSFNEVVKKLSEDVIVLLNDDMRFDKSFLEKQLTHFKSSHVFAVTSKVLNWDGNRTTEAKHTAVTRRFWFKRVADDPIDACHTLYAGGGCAAFRREMFVSLGGFDRLYYPAYWEDVDLSVRAWNRGWTTIYEPRSVIYHRVGATLKTTAGGTATTRRLMRRNEILFVLANVGGYGFLLGYLLLLPGRALRSAARGSSTLAKAMLMAIPRVPAALARRSRRSVWAKEFPHSGSI